MVSKITGEIVKRLNPILFIVKMSGSTRFVFAHRQCVNLREASTKHTPLTSSSFLNVYHCLQKKAWWTKISRFKKFKAVPERDKRCILGKSNIYLNETVIIEHSYTLHAFKKYIPNERTILSLFDSPITHHAFNYVPLKTKKVLGET